MKSVSHCLFTGALLDTFFLGRIGVVAIYSYPHQGFNGSTVFLITMSVFDVIEINIIIGTPDQMSMFKKMTNIGQVESNKNYTQQVLVLSKI